jgi:purine-binding chemotaxis protein CheW
MEQATESAVRARAGKYLTFTLGQEVYGVEIQHVREIIGVVPITTVPRTPSYIKGVINLRGKIIPVVDLRVKFRMEEHEATRISCIIIVAVTMGETQIWMGLIVDSVSEVLNVAGADLEAVPSFGVDFDTSFLLGMARSKSGVRLLLDIQRVLSQDEVRAAESAVIEAVQVKPEEKAG